MHLNRMQVYSYTRTVLYMMHSKHRTYLVADHKTRVTDVLHEVALKQLQPIFEFVLAILGNFLCLSYIPQKLYIE